MNQFFKYLVIVSLALTFWSCGDDDSPAPTPVSIDRPYDFIWEAMNSFYLWQEEKGDNLSDTKDDNINTYAEFLESYSTPEALFEDLLYQPNVVDHFSFMTDDYNNLLNSFQGIKKSFGHNFEAVAISGDYVIAVVRYVLNDSPAQDAGLERGDIIVRVNGERITRSNYYNLLYEQENVVYGLAQVVAGQLIETGEMVTMAAVEINENPVFLKKVINLSNGKKVGYLVYNQFVSQYNDELNDAFASLSSAGITDLVLDLRYNPGGSILTSSYLGSMIYSTDENKIFNQVLYNSKHTRYNGSFNFSPTLKVYNSDLEQIGTSGVNSLGMNKLYILTGRRTASSSELIINGLNPFIDVVQIGETTVGKNVGSLTLFDSPNSDYTDLASANSEHTYAIQPIISKSANSAGFSDYTNGFAPDIEVVELDYLGNYKPLGDQSEPLLAKALEQICSSCRVGEIEKTFDSSYTTYLGESGDDLPAYQHFTLNELFLQ